MADAARAIIIENSNLLLMHRDKDGKQYFTLVGGRVGEHETPEQAVVREVKEETGLDITSSRLVYFEDHAPPHNRQYIFLCQVAPHSAIAIQDTSEEALLNQLSTNYHKPMWVTVASFPHLSFLTMQLQQAIVTALKKGFPDTPVKL